MELKVSQSLFSTSRGVTMCRDFHVVPDAFFPYGSFMEEFWFFFSCSSIKPASAALFFVERSWSKDILKWLPLMPRRKWCVWRVFVLPSRRVDLTFDLFCFGVKPQEGVIDVFSAKWIGKRLHPRLSSPCSWHPHSHLGFQALSTRFSHCQYK